MQGVDTGRKALYLYNDRCNHRNKQITSLGEHLLRLSVTQINPHYLNRVIPA